MSDSTFTDQFNQCIQSFKSFKIHFPFLLTEIRTCTSYTINILLDEIAYIISSKGTSPARKFYALYFLLKALEKRHETLAIELAQKDELVSKIFHAAQFDITRNGTAFERGIKFFSLSPSREQAKAGINYVKLCLELLTHLDDMYGVTSQKDPLYIYRFFMNSLQKKGKIPGISWFLGKDYIVYDKKELYCWNFNVKSPLIQHKDTPDIYSIPIPEVSTIYETSIRKKPHKMEESGISMSTIDLKKNTDWEERLEDQMEVKRIESDERALSSTFDMVMANKEESNMVDSNPRQSKLLKIDQNNDQYSPLDLQTREGLTCSSQGITSKSNRKKEELTQNTQNGGYQTCSTRSKIVNGVNNPHKKEIKGNEIHDFPFEARIRMGNRDEETLQELQTQNQSIKNKKKPDLPKAEEQERLIVHTTPTNRQTFKTNQIEATELLHKVDRIATEGDVAPQRRDLQLKYRESLDSSKTKLLSGIWSNAISPKEQSNRDLLKNMNEASGVLNLSRSTASYGQFRTTPGPRDLKESSSSLFEDTAKKIRKTALDNMQADLQKIENSIRQSMQNKAKYGNAKSEELLSPSTQPRSSAFRRLGSFQSILNEIATTNGCSRSDALEDNSLATSLATKNEESSAVQNETQKNERVPLSSFNKIYKEDLKFKKLFQSESSALDGTQETKKYRKTDKGLQKGPSDWKSTVIDRTKFECNKKSDSDKNMLGVTINSTGSRQPKEDKKKVYQSKIKESSERAKNTLKPKEKSNILSINTEESDNDKTPGPTTIFVLLAPYYR